VVGVGVGVEVGVIVVLLVVVIVVGVVAVVLLLELVVVGGGVGVIVVEVVVVVVVVIVVGVGVVNCCFKTRVVMYGELFPSVTTIGGTERETVPKKWFCSLVQHFLKIVSAIPENFKKLLPTFQDMQISTPS